MLKKSSRTGLKEKNLREKEREKLRKKLFLVIRNISRKEEKGKRTHKDFHQ